MTVTTEVPLNLYGLSREVLRDVLANLGAEPFRARQAFRWLYGRRVFDPSSWTDFPKPLRERVASSYRVEPAAVADRVRAADGTVKYRLQLDDGRSVEAVRMVQRGRVTLCLSSQVGCALACDFCLTARMGLERHLDPGEIVGQVARILEDEDDGDPRYNVVLMGMGEPLHNYEGVMAAVRLLNDADGFAVSTRRITVSTAGLVPAIDRLAEEPVRPRLAVSLNATNDPVRDRLMPINRKHPLSDLLAACERFSRRTGEPVTFEYVLLEGVNDTGEDAARLERIARRHRAKLNLIPFNEVPGWLTYRSPSREKVVALRDRLLAAGIRVSIRWSRGAEARAACGQLAVLRSGTEGRRKR